MPCVSTDVHGSREVLEPGAPGEPCGLVVPVEDSPALADALRRVLDDRELSAALAARGPARVREAFTVDRMLDETLAVYREALS